MKLGWLYFVFVQGAAFSTFLIGTVLLVPFAACRLWTDAPIPQWRGGWLTYIWGNLEDGVIGAPFYRARFKDDRWCSYCWSAWRNNANNLRYIFRWHGGPFVRKQWGKWTFQAGWFQDNGFPVLSGGFNRK
jgi:hypothetical protein